VAYKVVVINEGGEYCSLISIWAATSQKYAVKYNPYEWAHPKLSGSRLFVWKNLADALWFVKNCSIDAVALFKCRTKDLKEIRRVSAIPSSDGNIERFWQNPLYPGYIQHALNGTYCASAVMITERVET